MSESNEKVVELVKVYLEKEFPKARAIIAVHQDTDDTHAHVWIDARQTDGKKIHLKEDKFEALDEKWTEEYDRTYGTNFASEYKALKDETQKWKKEMYEWRKAKREKVEGAELKPQPIKPQRAADRFTTDYWKEKEVKELTGAKKDEKISAGTSYSNAQRTGGLANAGDKSIEGAEYVAKSAERANDGGERTIQRTESDFSTAIDDSGEFIQPSSDDRQSSESGGTGFIENEIILSQHYDENYAYPPQFDTTPKGTTSPEFSKKRLCESGIGFDQSDGINLSSSNQEDYRRNSTVGKFNLELNQIPDIQYQMPQFHMDMRTISDDTVKLITNRPEPQKNESPDRKSYENQEQSLKLLQKNPLQSDVADIAGKSSLDSTYPTLKLAPTFAPSDEMPGNGNSVLIADAKSTLPQAVRLSSDSNFRNTTLIEQKQPDETYAEFQSIFKQAGLEKILETKSGAAQFETLGSSPARYEIKFADDEIKFNKIRSASDKSDQTVENSGVAFRKNEAGNYRIAASSVVPENLYPEAAARYIKKDALGKIDVWKTGELSKNIIVAYLDIENDSAAEEIKEINRANLEKYVSRRLGRELAAKIAMETAKHNETKFKDNVNDECLQITADIGKGEETRQISRADLRRERESIALNNVNNAKKSGTIEGIAEDERISFETAEKRQYGKETVKTQAMQKPWIESLDKAIADETARLEQITAQADLQLKAETFETGLIIKQIGIEDTKQIQPTLSPEKIWLEQIKAVKRGDAETFIKLEEIHQGNNLPRPNDVYARLRGIEAVSAMNLRRENQHLVERFGKEPTEQNIVVNVRRESGELKLEAWRVQPAGKQPAKSIEEAQENHNRAEAGMTPLSIETPRPLMDKINPVSPVKANLAWINDRRETINPYLNPIGVIKSDEGLQIVRAVAGYIDRKNKNEQVAGLTEAAFNAAKVLEKESASNNTGSAAGLSDLNEAIKKAVGAEESLRENLRQNKSLNRELLKTPKPALNDAEMKEIGRTALETGEAQETKKYYDLVKKDTLFAAAVGETDELASVKFFLAEARAARESNNAIEQITPLGDGSINVELNPARLTQAINSFRTADVFEESQAAAAKKSVIRSLSLEDISQTGQFLAANNQLADALNNQVYTIANDLMKNLQPPPNQIELEALKNPIFSQDFSSRFEQINRSERFLDDMSRQAELGAANSIPYQLQARNSTLINPNDALEAEEMRFWEDDRTQRESKIAEEHAASRAAMTKEQKAQSDVAELEETEAFEAVHTAIEIKTKSRILDL